MTPVEKFLETLLDEFEHAEWTCLSEQVRIGHDGKRDETAMFYQGVLRDGNRVVVCTFSNEHLVEGGRGYDGAVGLESERMLLRLSWEHARKACEIAAEKLKEKSS